MVAATLLFVAAWRVLGAARVGFVSEFAVPEQFAPIQRGVYGTVRHPLFWSGVLCSLAIALICPSPVSFTLALINAGYGLIYNRLEDYRLVSIFGRAYGDYANAVPHIIPAKPGRRFTLRAPRIERS